MLKDVTVCCLAPITDPRSFDFKAFVEQIMLVKYNLFVKYGTKRNQKFIGICQRNNGSF